MLPKYCSKAHAEQASWEWRAADVAQVEESLRQAEALAQTVPAAIAALQERLERLQGFLAQAQERALNRVNRAEAETRAARQAASDNSAPSADKFSAHNTSRAQRPAGPLRILGALPTRMRPTFLTKYESAINATHNPERYHAH